MVTFNEAVSDAAKGTLCALLIANDNVNALLSSITRIPQAAYPSASGLRRQLCSDDPDNDPVYEPPFEGGQCSIPYILDLSLFNDGVNVGNSQRKTLGPIAGVREVSLDPGNPNLKTRQIGSFSALLNTTSCTGTVVPAGFAWRSFGSGINATIVLNSVTPCGTDNCGDPPPPPPDPRPVPAPPVDITYDIDGDTNITIPVGFIYSPFYISPNFDINTTVEFNAGGIEFKGELTVSPEFKFDFSPKGIDAQPGVPDDDNQGGGGGGGTPVPEDETDADLIIGVLVFSTVTGNNSATVLNSTNGPNIYAPRIGSVQFAIKTGNSIGWTADQDIKNLESYVPCPAPQGAIAVRCTPAPGITRTFTPVRGRPLTPT